MTIVSKFFGGQTYDPFLSLMNKCPVLSTPTDWKETEDAHVFVADLPGLKKDDVRVEVVNENGKKVLQLSGERKAGEENGEEIWHRVERCRGEFRRKFRLPENANADEIKANMENGVLVVTVKKQEVKKPERKVIEIQEK